MALWYLVTPQMLKKDMEQNFFGFHAPFSGHGIFVYADGSDVKVVHYEDLGTEQWDLAKVARESTRANSCTIESKYLQSDISFNLSTANGELFLTYAGKDSKPKKCFGNIHASNLKYQGFLGVTAGGPK